jgi:cell wall-associated NlpC family hydrolase
MAHYTVSQFDGFPHVPLDQLQPGDLVFFNVDLGHMGMYIGNGNIVQAPRTGDIVKVTSLNGRTVVGVARPG